MSKWNTVLQDLRRQGVQDILVICPDNLSGFTDGINDVFPTSIVQRCIVHQVRNTLKYINDKDRKKVIVDLRRIYTSDIREQVQSALEINSESSLKTKPTKN